MRPARQSFQTSKKTASRSYTGSEPYVRFSLEVVQSPQRARTCGFGSKDRRPLQPAAVARLHAIRTDTGAAIDPDEIDTTFFVAMAELWTPSKTTNVTMIADPTLPVTHRDAGAPYAEPTTEDLQPSVVLSDNGFPYNRAAPSLPGPYPSQPQQMYPLNATFPSTPGSVQGLDSTAVGAPYPSFVSSDPSLNTQGSFYPGYSAQFTPYTYPSQPGFFDPSSQQMIPGPSSTNSNSPPTQPDFYAQPAGASVSSFVTYTSVAGPSPSRSAQGSPMSSRSGSGSLNAAPQGQSSQAGSRRGSPPDAASFGLDVHNLLGPTVANAFKLHDEKDRLGIFFVFQDLSVRTEGHFRLKVKLLCVAAFGAYEVTQQPSSILAEAWSGIFRVDPPKKFDGVPESTPLSDAFHRQGVKISTRKQKSISSRKRGRGAVYPSDDEDEEED